MPSVLEKYRTYFRPGEEEHEDRVRKYRDVTAGIPALLILQDELMTRKAKKRWEPGMPTEIAANHLIAQSIYDEMLDMINGMVKKAKEFAEDE